MAQNQASGTGRSDVGQGKDSIVDLMFVSTTFLMKHITHVLLAVTLTGCGGAVSQSIDTESQALLPCELEGTGFPRAWRFSFELVTHSGCILTPTQSDLLVTQVSGPKFPDLTGPILICDPPVLNYDPETCEATQVEVCTSRYGPAITQVTQRMEHGGNNFVFGTVDVEVSGSTSSCTYQHDMFGVILDQ